MTGTVNRDWAKSQGKDKDVTSAEMDEVIQSEIARRSLSPDEGTSMWTLQEELLEPKQSSQESLGSSLRLASHFLMAATFIAVFMKELRSLLGQVGSVGKVGKEDSRIS